MKILLSTNYQPPRVESGGIEFAAVELRDCWESLGHSVTWFTSDIPKRNPPPQPNSIRIPALNPFQKRWGIDIPVFSPSAWPAIRRALREHDVVNTHSLTPGITVLLMQMALARKKPIVTTQHVPVIKLKPAILNVVQEKILCFNARWCVRHGGLLTFVSEAVRDWFMEKARLSAESIRLTPVGINQRDFRFVPEDERRELRAKWKVPNDRMNALFIGRYEDKKGVPLIRQMAEQLPGINFTLRGSGTIDVDGWSLPNVRTVGFITATELRELYGSHDLFILPSYGEGWPAVVPQAMACGLACCISEEAFHGYNKDPGMFLVRERKIEAWIETLRAASEGRISLLNERKRLSDYAMQTWNWTRTAEIYIRLFEEQMRL